MDFEDSQLHHAGHFLDTGSNLKQLSNWTFFFLFNFSDDLEDVLDQMGETSLAMYIYDIYERSQEFEKY